MNNNELQENVIQWASDRMLLSKDNALKQLAKTMSELGELADAIIKNDTEGIVDGLGDVQVTLIILADQLGIPYDGALESAWNEIKNRKGKTIGGTFIKETV